MTDRHHRNAQDAKLRLDYLNEVQKDFDSGAVPSPDGGFVVHRAMRLENLALKEYGRVLRIFTDLVADGIIPDEGRSDNRES